MAAKRQNTGQDMVDIKRSELVLVGVDSLTRESVSNRMLTGTKSHMKIIDFNNIQPKPEFPKVCSMKCLENKNNGKIQIKIK